VLRNRVALDAMDTTHKLPEIHDVMVKNTTLILFLHPSLLTGADPLGSWKSHHQSRIRYLRRSMNLWLLGQSTLCTYDIFRSSFAVPGLSITLPIGIAREWSQAWSPKRHRQCISDEVIIPNIPFYFCAWRAWCHWRGKTNTLWLHPSWHSLSSFIFLLSLAYNGTKKYQSFIGG
jgi:hypothetical protein